MSHVDYATIRRSIGVGELLRKCESDTQENKRMVSENNCDHMCIEPWFHSWYRNRVETTYFAISLLTVGEVEPWFISWYRGIKTLYPPLLKLHCHNYLGEPLA